MAPTTRPTVETLSPDVDDVTKLPDLENLDRVLAAPTDSTVLTAVKQDVHTLTKAFPLYL